MSVVAAAGDPVPPEGAPARAWRWVPVDPTQAFDCGETHARPGRFDESARRVSHPELEAGLALVADGHHVRALPERRGQGATADFAVCSLTAEVKSWESLELRNGRAPSAESVHNKLIQACRQSPHAVLVGGASGLTPAAARRGVSLFARSGAGSLGYVRILGDGFDLAWKRLPVPERTVRFPAPRGREPGRRLGI